MSSPSDPPPSDPLLERPARMTILAASGWAFGVTIALQIALSTLVKLRPAAADDMVSSVACQAIVYLTAIFLILRVHAPEASVRDFAGLRRTHLLLHPLALLLGVAVWPPIEALAHVIEKRWPIQPPDHIDELFRAASPAWRVGLVVAITAVGPLLEEILFRGALFRGLRRVYPATLAVFTTAWLFWAAHLHWQYAFTIGLLGLLLGQLRSRSGSSLPGVFMHAAFNGSSVLALAYAPPDAVMPTRIALGSAAAAALLVLAFHLVSARSATAARARELDLE